MNELTREDLYMIKTRLPRVILETMKARQQRVFLAGGFIRAVIAKEVISDIDLFTTDKEEAESLANELKGASNGAITKTIRTDNALTLLGLKYPVQIIHRWTFTNPMECVESFDFTIAKSALWFEGEVKSTCHPMFYADLASKRLRYTSPVREEEAGGSMLRLIKFVSRGYHPMLDSLAAVVTRLISKVDFNRVWDSEQITKVISGLLREVDPLIPECK